MTHEKWIKMTPEEQRIKIASLLGIVDIEEEDWALCDICDIGLWEDKLNGEVVNVPDYCTDLNAMHEAENSMTEAQTYRMADKLCTILSDKPGIDGFIHHANSAQRAEAFVLIMEPEAG